MGSRPWLPAVGLVAALIAMPAGAQEEGAKYGGVLTYMIPADAPPSFDAHREETYATIHSAALSTARWYGSTLTIPDRLPTSFATYARRCRSRPTAARLGPSRSARASSFITATR